jgi:sugar lactone lactonase YvrE
MNDIGPKDANVEIRDPAFHGVVGDATPIERIATGFLFTEGPLWHAREKYLLFSDMPGDHMRKWSARGEVATFRKPCAQSNGLAWDRQGRLLVCFFHSYIFRGCLYLDSSNFRVAYFADVLIQHRSCQVV